VEKLMPFDEILS